MDEGEWTGPLVANRIRAPTENYFSSFATHNHNFKTQKIDYNIY